MINETTPAADPLNPQPAKQNKWIWGCGIGCLGFIIIAILAIASGTWYFLSLVNDMEDELIAQGLTKQSGQFIEVKDPITEPQYFKGQIVMIRNGSDAPIGLLCQMAELRGEFHQPVTFRGQILTIHKDAVLHQGLDVTAQLVERVGKVEGEITGSFQALTETAEMDYSQFEGMFPAPKPQAKAQNDE